MSAAAATAAVVNNVITGAVDVAAAAACSGDGDLGVGGAVATAASICELAAAAAGAGGSGGSAVSNGVTNDDDDDDDATMDGTTSNAEHIICRYFLQGTCRFGPRCRFSHDLNNANDDATDTVQRSDAQNLSTVVTIEEIPSTSSKVTPKSYKKNKSAPLMDWANAPEFVPGRFKPTTPSVEHYAESSVAKAAAPTWASIVGGGSGSGGSNANRMRIGNGVVNLLYGNQIGANEVCPYEGPCPHGCYCLYPVHMELCEMCDQYCLHPTDVEQRRKHKKECLLQHEQAMELSFAIARSKDKTCGICFDTIMEKSGREKRFGILPNCSHIFCLECIRKWRQAKQFEHKITRSCPECRISSDFVCPSAFWVETKEEKDKLLNDYRAALGIKDCKYFKKGDGRCPFGNKCFYKHALPNGDLVDVGLPKRARKVRRSASETTDLLAIYLWEYIDIRDFDRDSMISVDTDDDDDDYNDDDDSFDSSVVVLSSDDEDLDEA